MTAAKGKLGVGRPRAGIGGEPSSTYPQLSVRVPPETIRQCAALAKTLGLSQWQVVRNAIDWYYRRSRRDR